MFNNLKTRIAMNVKMPVFVSLVEAVIYYENKKGKRL